MLLKSMRLNNIRSYVNEDIIFPTGSTLLAGDIGTGKTTVLLALDFALFGLRRGELTGNDLLRHGENTGSVELTFEVDGNDILIKRTLKKEKNGAATQDSGYIEINGISSYKAPTELRAKVLELLGYPQEFITKNPILFRYTVYTPQDQMKRIFLSDEERLETIRKIFGIDKYGRIRENSRIILTELRAMRRVLESKVADLDERIIELSEKHEIKKHSLFELEKNQDMLEGMDEEIFRIKTELDEIKKKSVEINQISREISINNSEMMMKNQRLGRISNEMREFEKNIYEFSKVLEEKIERPTYMTEIEVRNKITELERQKKEIISEESKLSHEIRKLQDIFNDGVCSFCEQPVRNREAFGNRIEEKIISKNTMVDDLLKNESEIKTLTRIYDELVAYNHRMQTRILIENNYKSALDSKKKLEEEKEKLLIDIQHLEEANEMLEQRMAKFADFEAEKAGVELKLEDANKRRMAAEKELSRIEQQVENIDAIIADLEKEIEEKKADKQRILRLVDFVNWMDNGFIVLMDVMERHVLATIQKEFNEYFQNWFSLLVSDELLSIKIDEQFTPLIQQNGYDTLYENLSGGEKTAVALAYRLSLNKVINMIMEKIKTSDLIILDEPTDGFSSEQLDRVRDVLAELNLKQMIIVSHEPKIDTFVDNVIRFYKEHHVTRVEQ